MSFRFLHDDGAPAAAGLATDEFLMRQAGSDPVLRLYTYRSHCALVGRFQDLDLELNVPECRRRAVQMNRRPTGGGAIIMGEGQLGVAFAGPPAAEPSGAILRRIAGAIIAGLGCLGIEAELRGKNDLAVGGRKIAGLGVCRAESGAFLFHASVLVDLDVGLMLRLLRVPAEKLGADGPSRIAAVEQRMTTVRRETRGRVDMTDVRASVLRGFAGLLRAAPSHSTLDASERAAIGDLVRTKYGTRAWTHERSGGGGPSAGTGSARAPGGLVRAWVVLAGGAIQDVRLTADFVDASPGLLPGIEARLRWAPVDRVGALIAASWPAGAAAPDGVGAEHVAQAVARAIEAVGTGRYACFAGTHFAGTQA